MSLPELLTEEQAAQALHISRARLAKLARAGHITFVKVGRSRVYTEDMVGQILTDFTTQALAVTSVRARRHAGRTA